MREISTIIPAEKVNMGGNIIDQPLPVSELEMHDPFLLIHHWKHELLGNRKQQDLGVGPHPHRGFSPVTIIFDGAVHHRDSRGNDSVVQSGGTQWMNAGMGITHSERPSKELAENGGMFEFIQFWVNSPANLKMKQPEYQALDESKIPVFCSDDERASIQIIAGEQFGMKGPTKVDWPLLILRLDLKKGGKILLDIPSDFNALFYNLDGNVTINSGKRVFMKDMAVFEKSEETEILIEANDVTRAILLAGKPINEPVASYGPFVMNNETQLMQALRDAQMGKMGILIEEF
ncbi:MAG: pirin family protein [Flavobacteriales bacterium]|nr:pirin family protein [Flavobacteriales bacterium]